MKIKKSIINLLERAKNKEVKEKRNLTLLELKELLRMTELVNGELWKSSLISGNTALIEDGQKLAKQQEGVARLLLNAKNGWVSQLLANCGYPNGVSLSINSETGEIKEAEIPVVAKL